MHIYMHLWAHIVHAQNIGHILCGCALCLLIDRLTTVFSYDDHWVLSDTFIHNNKKHWLKVFSRYDICILVNELFILWQYYDTEIHAPPWSFTSVKSCICLNHCNNVILAEFRYRQSSHTFSLKSEVELTCGSFPVPFEGSWNVNPAGEKINTMTVFSFSE